MRRARVELRRCWPSLAGAALVVPGYWMVGHSLPVGWLLMAGSNMFMLVVVTITRQWGLLVAILPMLIAVHNFLWPAQPCT